MPKTEFVVGEISAKDKKIENDNEVSGVGFCESGPGKWDKNPTRISTLWMFS